MLSEKNISMVLTLLQKAGEEIMNIYRKDDFQIRIKEDQSPVTVADMTSDRIIKSGLSEITPDLPVFSEETRDVSFNIRSGWDRLWVLDPIDGTKEFIARNDEFCISLALVERNVPVAGFIHSPVTDTAWFAIAGAGAWKIEKNLKTRLPVKEQSGAFRINISRSHGSPKEDQWIKNFGNHYETMVSKLGSAIKFCKIAEGESDIYPKFAPTHDWDIAAGHLIIQEAGGKIIRISTGRPPVYNMEDYHQPPFLAFGRRVSDWEKWI